LTAEAASSTSISLSWNSVDGAEAYRILRSTSDTGPFAEVGECQTTSYTDNDLETGATYFYYVTAYSGVNESAPSGTVQITLTATAPETPQNVSASAISSSEISISFNAATGASGYRIYRSASESGSFTLLSEVGGSPYSNTGLNSGSTWYYRVSAYNDGGESAQSGTVSATTQQESTTHYYCVIDPGACRDCSRCIGSCPNNAISDAGSYKVIDKTKCNAEGCQACKQACDSYAGAISVQQEVLSKIKLLFK
jgi:fibronectin type 3 domain-containing protein